VTSYIVEQVARWKRGVIYVIRVGVGLGRFMLLSNDRIWYYPRRTPMFTILEIIRDCNISIALGNNNNNNNNNDFFPYIDNFPAAERSIIKWSRRKGRKWNTYTNTKKSISIAEAIINIQFLQSSQRMRQSTEHIVVHLRIINTLISNTVVL
jgi:hypothetical protein